jgi:hypothetical protein
MNQVARNLERMKIHRPNCAPGCTDWSRAW